MSAVLESRLPGTAPWRLEWLPIIGGLVVLFLPTFFEAATTFWQLDENAHAPLVLAVVIWLFWHNREAYLHAPSEPRQLLGIAVLVFGLLLYVLGRSQEIRLFEIGSLTPIIAGVVLAMRGSRALRPMWFPLLFVAFMLPLPGFFVDAVTAPLKQYISTIVEQALYGVGYPIARDGVVLVIGQYELLVADACSGLHTMFSLAALGLLFMYMKGRRSILHNAVMAASILPIAFAANVVRVVLVTLITYYFGDEAGQGYLHGAAGIVLLLAALIFLVALDAVLARVLATPKPAAGHA